MSNQRQSGKERKKTSSSQPKRNQGTGGPHTRSKERGARLCSWHWTLLRLLAPMPFKAPPAPPHPRRLSAGDRRWQMPNNSNTHRWRRTLSFQNRFSNFLAFLSFWIFGCFPSFLSAYRVVAACRPPIPPFAPLSFFLSCLKQGREPVIQLINNNLSFSRRNISLGGRVREVRAVTRDLRR